MAATMERPKRSVPRRNYRKLADLQLPSAKRKVLRKAQRKAKLTREEPDELYRLEVIEEDSIRDRVRVRYIGYEGDEWRARSDIVQLSSDPEDESEGEESPVSCHVGSTVTFPVCVSLYEQLAYKIKSLLLCSLKGDPACNINMPFDSIHFDGLIRRSIPVQDRAKSFTVTKLTNLDELLGRRWYIRGVNAAGDFSYVKPETSRFYLRKSKSKPDYQWENNGTLTKHYFGTSLHIVFKFVRGDGNCSHWDHVLKLCSKS